MRDTGEIATVPWHRAYRVDVMCLRVLTFPRRDVDEQNALNRPAKTGRG